MFIHLHEIYKNVKFVKCLAKIVVPFLLICVKNFLFFVFCTVHVDLHIPKQAGWFLWRAIHTRVCSNKFENPVVVFSLVERRATHVPWLLWVNGWSNPCVSSLSPATWKCVTDSGMVWLLPPLHIRGAALHSWPAGEDPSELVWAIIVISVIWSSSKQVIWSENLALSINRNLSEGCVCCVWISTEARETWVCDRVMVHTARTALPATLAAVLLRATMWLYSLCIYLYTGYVWVTPLDSCVARHQWGLSSPQYCGHNTWECGLYSKLYVHLCISFCTEVPITSFSKHSCASIIYIFIFSCHEAAEYNSQGAEHIRQTTLSILGTAHLTYQILLYECKPIKWSSSVLFGVASCMCCFRVGESPRLAYTLGINLECELEAMPVMSMCLWEGPGKGLPGILWHLIIWVWNHVSKVKWCLWAAKWNNDITKKIYFVKRIVYLWWIWIWL